MFGRLANFITRHWLAVILFWATLPIVLVCVAPKWSDVTNDGDFAYLPARMTSSRGAKLLAESFPELASKSSLVFVVARSDGRLEDEDYAVADSLAEKYAPKEGVASPIASVMTHDEKVMGKKLVSPVGPNGQAVLVVLQFNTEMMAIRQMGFIKRIYDEVDSLSKSPDFPKGLTIGVTGSTAIGRDMLWASDRSIHNTEWTTALLVIVILLLVYRAPGLVVVPLMAIGVSFIVSTNIIALLAKWSATSGIGGYQIFTTSQIFIIVVLFGAATDYCLFLIARYREELERGLPPINAIHEALSRTGHALTASAMTTILGLGVMLYSDFGKYRSGGPTIAMSLVVALAACLTLAPAVLCALGKAVFWPFGIGSKKRGGKGANPQGRLELSPPGEADSLNRFWSAIANVIVTRPGLILVCSFALLAIPAYQGLSVPITYDMLAEMDPHEVSVQGTQLLKKYFPIGETGPISILAKLDNGDFSSPEGRKLVTSLTKELQDFERPKTPADAKGPVLSVRSLTNPLGKNGVRWSPFDKDAMIALTHPRTKATYLAAKPGYENKVTRFDLICAYDPMSRESMNLLTRIDTMLKELKADPTSPWHKATFDFIGVTASLRDLDAVNVSDTFNVGVLVSIAVLGVLIFLLRRPVISLYLIFTVLFGYFLTLGITKLYFTWVYGDTFQGLDWKLKMFLFVILVAVGEDYNIYLVTRVIEEQKKLGQIEGLREAVIRTGGIITSCGVIMAGTFSSMMASSLRGMYEMGFALGLGVLLDTFIIRTILVPSFIALLARWTAKSAPVEPEEVAAPHYESPIKALDRAMSEPADQLAR